MSWLSIIVSTVIGLNIACSSRSVSQLSVDGEAPVPKVLSEAAAKYKASGVRFEFSSLTSHGKQTYFNKVGAERLATALNDNYASFVKNDIPTFKKAKNLIIIKVSNHWSWRQSVEYEKFSASSQREDLVTFTLTVNGLESEHSRDFKKDWRHILKRQFKFSKVISKYTLDSKSSIKVTTSGFGDDLFALTRTSRFWELIDSLPKALAGMQKMVNEPTQSKKAKSKMPWLNLYPGKGADEFRTQPGQFGLDTYNFYRFIIYVDNGEKEEAVKISEVKELIPGLEALKKGSYSYFSSAE